MYRPWRIGTIYVFNEHIGHRLPRRLRLKRRYIHATLVQNTIKKTTCKFIYRTLYACRSVCDGIRASNTCLPISSGRAAESCYRSDVDRQLVTSPLDFSDAETLQFTIGFITTAQVYSMNVLHFSLLLGSSSCFDPTSFNEPVVLSFSLDQNCSQWHQFYSVG